MSNLTGRLLCRNPAGLILHTQLCSLSSSRFIVPARGGSALCHNPTHALQQIEAHRLRHVAQTKPKQQKDLAAERKGKTSKR
jgi:hypothetical protein